MRVNSYELFIWFWVNIENILEVNYVLRVKIIVILIDINIEVRELFLW